MGDLFANTGSGVFGTLSDASLVNGIEPVAVAERSEVQVGPAVIRSNIAGEKVV